MIPYFDLQEAFDSFEKVSIEIRSEDSTFFTYPIEHLTSRGRSVYTFSNHLNELILDKISGGQELLSPIIDMDVIVLKDRMDRFLDKIKKEGTGSNCLIIFITKDYRYMNVVIFNDKDLYRSGLSAG